MSENQTYDVRLCGSICCRAGCVVIIGIGTDCCAVDRISGAMERRGASFLARVFTDAERAAGAKRSEPALYFARRFAAKEACAKALGTGITDRVRWQDFEILSGRKGQPTLRLAGGALRRLKQMTPRGHDAALHMSLSDEPPIAVAFVLLEARLKAAGSKR